MFRANKMLSFIVRSFEYKGEDINLPLYKSLSDNAFDCRADQLLE